MNSSYELVWPSVGEAIPVLLIFVVLPLWLTQVVLSYTHLARWKKVALIPLCMVSPLLVTAFWPFALKISGIIKFTGPKNFEAPYSWYASGLFGVYSDYVWAGLTAASIYLLRAALKARVQTSPNSTHGVGRPIDEPPAVADFRIVGRIQQMGPNEFSVMAAAQPEVHTPELIGKGVKWETVSSSGAAAEAQQRLIAEMKAWVRDRGDRVVDD
jgi:hypothetical protein